MQFINQFRNVLSKSKTTIHIIVTYIRLISQLIMGSKNSASTHRDQYWPKIKNSLSIHNHQMSKYKTMKEIIIYEVTQQFAQKIHPGFKCCSKITLTDETCWILQFTDKGFCLGQWRIDSGYYHRKVEEKTKSNKKLLQLEAHAGDIRNEKTFDPHCCNSFDMMKMFFKRIQEQIWKKI